jgi:hypothetical protein
MYVRPRRRRKPFAGVWVLLGTALFLLTPLLMANHSISDNNASAAPGPTRVQGHVYDSIGNTVYNAQVTVTFLASSASWSGSTDINGYYQSRSFAPSEWSLDETIEVTATYDLVPATNTSLAMNSVTQIINVTLSLVIPEFGTSFGFLPVVGFSMFVVIVAVRREHLR